MGFDSVCNTGLVLGLGMSSSTTTDPKTSNISSKNNNPCLSLDIHIAKTDTVRMALSYEPSLTLGLSGDYKKLDHHSRTSTAGAGGDLYRQDSAASSFSNVSVKRERDQIGTGSEEAETERVSSRVISDEDDDGVNGRKKLRLTKAQSALLEESFKQHSTLNPKQKQELARELKLRPRQVEVWFQNRRARTKLKQTEVDCEYLKKCCETLTEENRRLQKELQELKAVKVAAQPFYMQLPAATLTMCPSCERIGERERDNSATKTTVPTFTMAAKQHLFNPFTNPSAAC